GGDQQILRSVKPAAAHLRPPTADAVRGELRRVMVGSDTHPTLIVENVVDAVRNHFAQGLVLEVMDADFWRLALGMPFSPVILEIPDQFLLFCVDRNRRLPLSQAPTHQTVDVTELGVTVGVRIALTGFAIGLKAVAGFMQERRNCHPANRMTHLCQFIRQTSGALAGPTQGRFRVAASRRLDQRLQCRKQFGVAFGQRKTTTAGPAYPRRFTQTPTGRQVEFRKTSGDRSSRHARGTRHHRYPAITEATGLGSRPLSTHPFVHLRPQQFICAPNPFSYLCILHAQVNESVLKLSTKLNRLFSDRPLARFFVAPSRARGLKPPLSDYSVKGTRSRPHGRVDGGLPSPSTGNPA